MTDPININTKLRLGFYDHLSAIQAADGIHLPGYLGRFLDSLAQNCDHLSVFLHSPNQGEVVQDDYKLHSTNVRFILLPSKGSFPHQLIFAGKSTKLIRKTIGSLDAFLVRGPTPLMPSIARLCKSLPLILMLVGDQMAGIDASTQPSWRKSLIRLYWHHIYRGIQKEARNSLVFVNSHELYNTYNKFAENLVEIRTTTLTKEDFYQRDDTCQTKPIRLLYTGRIDLEKGLLDMVGTLSMLKSDGEDVRLDLVGWSKKVESNLIKVFTYAHELGVQDRISYHGYKAVGPDLFSYYRQADIFIIASQSSFEGFPRSIWEAMAHSLPVVATKVGSIPYFLKNEENALLVEPKSVVGLKESILRVIHEDGLRKRMVRNGFLLSQQNTLEVRSREIISEIKQFQENWKNR